MQLSQGIHEFGLNQLNCLRKLRLLLKILRKQTCHLIDSTQSGTSEKSLAKLAAGW